jgi:putative membrane protein
VSLGQARVLLAATAATFVALGIAPKTDRLTWFLENLPVVLGAPMLVGTHRRLPPTRLLSWLLFVHALVLMLGGHYSYAEVPVGHWIKDALGLERNHYDRLGHFVQGFVPAILVRELLLRLSPLSTGKLMFALVTLSCLGLSAVYELFEWGAALLFEAGATAFLGTQGDPWDTQWDMFLCGAGALLAQVLLSPVHDRELGVARDRGPTA